MSTVRNCRRYRATRKVTFAPGTAYGWRHSTTFVRFRRLDNRSSDSSTYTRIHRPNICQTMIELLRRLVLFQAPYLRAYRSRSRRSPTGPSRNYLSKRMTTVDPSQLSWRNYARCWLTSSLVCCVNCRARWGPSGWVTNAHPDLEAAWSEVAKHISELTVETGRPQCEQELELFSNANLIEIIQEVDKAITVIHRAHVRVPTDNRTLQKLAILEEKKGEYKCELAARIDRF